MPADADPIGNLGRALVHAIQSLETIEPSGCFERTIARLLVKAYRRRLRAIIGAAPLWMGNRILGAIEGSPDPYGALTAKD